VRGSTFTLSNLGMFGIESFTAILNPPEVAILSVGAVVDTPVGRNGQIVLRPMMQVTLNADHRVIDGAVAASFLRDFKELAEHPARLLL
jgi:pyruvate dehydrogenase E2 component (dihydrolipoamide acetyltransferase)